MKDKQVTFQADKSSIQVIANTLNRQGINLPGAKTSPNSVSTKGSHLLGKDPKLNTMLEESSHPFKAYMTPDGSTFLSKSTLPGSEYSLSSTVMGHGGQTGFNINPETGKVTVGYHIEDRPTPKTATDDKAAPSEIIQLAKNSGISLNCPPQQAKAEFANLVAKLKSSDSSPSTKST